MKSHPKAAPPSPEPRKHPINLLLHSADYALLRKFADEDRRSMTNYVLVVLLKHLYERAGQSNSPPNKPS